MSDTVKLIVTISKDQYEICKQALKDFGDRPITECEFVIAVGTPLDDVKSEIVKAQEPYITNTAYDEGVRFGLMLAYQIVDRCKESEDT